MVKTKNCIQKNPQYYSMSNVKYLLYELASVKATLKSVTFCSTHIQWKIGQPFSKCIKGGRPGKFLGSQMVFCF